MKLDHWIKCHSCDRKFVFALGDDDAPVTVHELPWCDAFSAIETIDDAIEYSRLCRAALGDHRE